MATVLEQTKARMQELKDQREAELEMIRQKIQEAGAKINAEGRAMQQATEVMDEEAYIKAKEERRRAQLAHEMYKGRLGQIMKQELITEEESDKVIDSLLSYEDQLAADFAESIAEPMAKLADLHNTYMAEVKDVENVIRVWTLDIHKNYRTRGASWRTDPVTGQQTDRSETPAPVRVTPYTGSPKAAQLGEYLRKAGVIAAGNRYTS